jgi:exodeoxyribonuclease V alpha subunit
MTTVDLVPRSVGMLAPLAASGILCSTELHVTDALARRSGLFDEVLLLAVALSVKAVRLEHVCFEVTDDGIESLWRGTGEVPLPDAPDPDVILRALRAAPRLVEVVGDGVDVDARGGQPLVLASSRCYLRRYALLEQEVAARLSRTWDLGTAGLSDIDACVATVADHSDETQLAAVRQALQVPVSVIAGGPGTGKTTTVALLLRVVRTLDPDLRIALAAPTGKAATRLNDAIRSATAGSGIDDLPTATTIHRLLGIGPEGVSRRARQIEADIVIVDEASMISLPLLGQLLDRVGLDARVVLVGDPDQLASIEVGAVLADVVAASEGSGNGVSISRLTTSHRFTEASGVAMLAQAVRSGDMQQVDRVDEDFNSVAILDPAIGREAVLDRVVAHAIQLIAAAREGDAEHALRLQSALGLLCATREGDGSTAWWMRRVEASLVEQGAIRLRDADYVGRPLMVTRNDPLTGLMNGTVGVIVADRSGPVAAFDSGTFPLASVPTVETVWALTIHKSQGSEYDEVIVSLPGRDSPILTRELVYTAVTRARETVTLIAPPGSLEAALLRRVARASGLAARLRRS